MSGGEQIGPRSKKVRGRAQASTNLIDAIFDIAEDTQPITGRGIGYKLFSRGLIPSMSRNEMKRVYRLLKEAREEDIIPWEWIVDETRELELSASWDNPDHFLRSMQRGYRREFWNHQPCRCILASEKGTVRGVLRPVLEKYGVGFLPLHGFSSATVAHDLAENDDGRDLVLLYVGDFDPSGMCMSEEDLPTRIAEYGGDHIEVRRIALQPEHTTGLLSFPAKQDDPRCKWFVSNYGNECWELDAMDPNDLRDCVELEIEELIEPEAWKRCEMVNAVEKSAISDFLKTWKKWDQPNWIDEFTQEESSQ